LVERVYNRIFDELVAGYFVNNQVMFGAVSDNDLGYRGAGF
jgi:hypothetical protein